MRKYLFLLPLFILGPACLAQENKNQFSVQTGVFIPSTKGKFSTIKGPGTHYSYDIGLSYSRRLKKGFSMGLDFSTFQSPASLHKHPLPHNNPRRRILPGMNQNSYAFVPFIKWQTNDRRKLSFYFSTGLGIQYQAPKAGSPSGFGYEISSRAPSFFMQKERSRIGNMVFAEAGVEYKINKRHSIGLSAAFKGSFSQSFFHEPAFAIPVNGHLRINNLNPLISGGLSLKLLYTYRF